MDLQSDWLSLYLSRNASVAADLHLLTDFQCKFHMSVCFSARGSVCYYPARACASKGLCDRSWCPYIIYCLDFFWNQSFISKNTHFEMSILTQIGFSSNLMASGTVQQLDKSSWPSQIPIVCRLGKGSPMPETHIAPNHTPTIADTVPKWLNTPTLLLGTWH